MALKSRPLHFVQAALALIFFYAAARGAETGLVIDSDFGAAGNDVSRDKNDRAAGTLPGAWHDNSTANVWVNYSRLEEQGHGFQRIHVTKLEDGQCQVTHPLPGLDADAYYQLSFRARSRTALRAQFGVRQLSPPFKFFWDVSPSLKPEWQEFSYEFHLDKSGDPIGFYIVLPGTGELDISNLSLTQRNRLQYIDTIKAKPVNGPKNLVRNSRLPLGLPCGWSLDRDLSDGDQVVIDSDDGLLGPSGAPPLRVKFASTLINTLMLEDKSERPVVLYSAPFGIAQGFEGHVASLSMRGAEKVKLQVICDGRVLAQKPFTPNGSDKWQRMEVSFKPVLMGRAYGLRIEATGKFWIDALQVERGEQATAYESAGACEVALACDSPARVQFDDENAELHWCVTGLPNRGTLKTKVVNVYGEESLLPGIPLTREFLQKGKLKYDLDKERNLGPFRVEAWVENAEHDRISPFSEIVVYRLHRPRYWKKDALNSPFGTHTLSTTRHSLMAKAAGINWVRLHDAGTEYVGWYHLERNKGQWTFHDSEIERYRLHNLKLLGELSTAPEWASLLEKKRNTYYDRYYAPKHPEDFAHYVKTVVKHYKGSIGSWEVWNEPWLPQYFHSSFDAVKGAANLGYLHGEDPHADYALLMKTAYKAAKSADSTALIAGFNTTAGGEPWTRGILAQDGLRSCDAISYHHYTGGFAGAPGDVVEQGWKQAVGTLLDNSGRAPKPIWLTEGSPTAGTIGAGFYKHTLPYADGEDVIDTSDRLCRYVVSLLGQGVQKVFLYSMHNHSYFGPKSEWRTLVTEEGYLHPCAAAHSAMAWQLEDTHCIKRAELAEGLTGYFFEGKERSVVVLSRRANGAELVLPVGKGLDVTDLFGNPVEGKLGTTLVYVAAKEMRTLTRLFGQ